MIEIIKNCKNDPIKNQIGFIISIKDIDKINANQIFSQAIVENNLKNVLLKKFVP